MKKILSVFLITFILMGFSTNEIKASTAKTIGDLYDNLEKLKQEKIEQDKNIQISEAEYKRVSNLIYESQKKVAEYNKEIEITEGEIRKLEEKIQEKKEEINRILVFLEVSNGENSYLEYIFKATSFTDFIHRVSIVEEISKYNKELINEMNDLIKQKKEKKKSLAESVKKEEEERKVLEANLRIIGNRINELYSEGATIEEQIENQEEIIAFYESKGCTDRNTLLSECTKIPPATGFIRPMVSGVVTSDYGYRISPITGVPEGHSGIDMANGILGTPVYPVAPGTVAFEVNWYKGGRVLGIHHIVNGVEYTSMYMHLKAFNVEVGDVVYTDDIIGYEGGIYDAASTGIHLHLSLLYGHLTNPGEYKNYIFDPAELIYFPSGWFYQRTWA